MESYALTSSSPPLHRVCMALILIVGMALAISVWLFAPMGMRLDEAQNLWQSSHSLEGALALVASDVHVPLYHVLLHFWLTITDMNLEQNRILPLTFFALAIVAVYILGRVAYGHTVGIMAASLAAVSPFLQWYGQELRMYSLLALLSAAHQALFIALIKKEGANRRVWFAYGIIALLGIYTHYFFALNLLAQAIFVFWYAERFGSRGLRHFALTAVVLFLSFLPWLMYILSRGETGYAQPQITAPTSTNLMSTFLQFLYGFQDDAFNTMAASAWPIAVLLLFLLLSRRVRPQTHAFAPEIVYLLMAFLVPILAAFAVSITLRPLFLTRYLTGALPAMYILIAWALVQYPRRVGMVLKPLLLVTMALALVYQAYNPATPTKENFREAAAYISANAEAQDIIIVSAPFTIYPVEYYYRGPARVVTLPSWDRRAHGPLPPFSTEGMDTDVQKMKTSHRRAWVLYSYDQGYEKDIRSYFETRFARLEEHSFSKGITLETYQLRYDFPTAVAER